MIIFIALSQCAGESLSVQVSTTCRELSEAQVLHGPGGDEWFLRVVQHMSECVHSHVEVGDVDAHGLLPHGGLIRVPGGLKETRGQGGASHWSPVV